MYHVSCVCKVEDQSRKKCGKGADVVAIISYKNRLGKMKKIKTLKINIIKFLINDRFSISFMLYIFKLILN